jgi:hypothetical protein
VAFSFVLNVTVTVVVDRFDICGESMIGGNPVTVTVSSSIDKLQPDNRAKIIIQIGITIFIFSPKCTMSL